METSQMTARVFLMGCVVLLGAACDDMQGANTGGATDGLLTQLPEGVLEVAARNQDLTAVRIDPTDGCYVYRYRGPVETTFLPLRTEDGRPICSRSDNIPATG